MSNLYNAQVAYDYQEPHYYSEIEYDMSFLSFEELQEFIADEDTRESFRQACKDTIKRWPRCEYCDSYLKHFNDKGICEDCAELENNENEIND